MRPILSLFALSSTLLCACQQRPQPKACLVELAPEVTADAVVHRVYNLCNKTLMTESFPSDPETLHTLGSALTVQSFDALDSVGEARLDSILRLGR